MGKSLIAILTLATVALSLPGKGAKLTSTSSRRSDVSRVVANPVDIDYAFTRRTTGFYDGMREAADPVVRFYKGRYYLFASMSFGYWSSDDMQHWHFITNDRMPFANYAPALMVYKDELYWFVSHHNTLYKTATPEDGDSWTVASENISPFLSDSGRTVHDPYLFPDDDGRVYLYWGCSYKDPIVGVELDPEDGFRAKTQPVALIGHNEKTYGFECRGDRNEIDTPSCNEGSALLKYEGRYYLQYAAPGTEYDTYGDGLYVGDTPLGPFEHCDYSPFSIKPGGWMTGAGHGDTFQDKYGNWWHVSTTVIVQRFCRERRIGFYPVLFTQEGGMHALTEWSDYPWILPDRKVDWTRESPWTGWMNLTLGKTATASSERPDHPVSQGCDNTIKTWWSAATGEPGEWYCVDLGSCKTVRAVHTNFADQDFGVGPDPKTPYCYTLETSRNGKTWHMMKKEDGTHNPHQLVVPDHPVRARYVRLRNDAPLTGKLSLFDLRVFGQGGQQKPDPVRRICIERATDPRRIKVSWTPSRGADGYILHWGVQPNALFSACEVYDYEIELGLFSVNQDYWFRVDAFNERGVTPGGIEPSTQLHMGFLGRGSTPASDRKKMKLE